MKFNNIFDVPIDSGEAAVQGVFEETTAKCKLEMDKVRLQMQKSHSEIQELENQLKVGKMTQVEYFTCLNIKNMNYCTAFALAGIKEDFIKIVIVFISHWVGVHLSHAIIQVQQQSSPIRFNT